MKIRQCYRRDRSSLDSAERRRRNSWRWSDSEKTTATTIHPYTQNNKKTRTSITRVNSELPRLTRCINDSLSLVTPSPRRQKTAARADRFGLGSTFHLAPPPSHEIIFESIRSPPTGQTEPSHYPRCYFPSSWLFFFVRRRR